MKHIIIFISGLFLSCRMINGPERYIAFSSDIAKGNKWTYRMYAFEDQSGSPKVDKWYDTGYVKISIDSICSTNYDTSSFIVSIVDSIKRTHLYNQAWLFDTLYTVDSVILQKTSYLINKIHGKINGGNGILTNLMFTDNYLQEYDSSFTDGPSTITNYKMITEINYNSREESAICSVYSSLVFGNTRFTYDSTILINEAGLVFNHHEYFQFGISKRVTLMLVNFEKSK